jgi:proteasome lid subunit RPN8/RPN11
MNGICGGAVEFCGMICERCRNGQREWMHTPPVRGTEKSELPKNIGGRCDPQKSPCPHGWIAVGYYHSHPRLYTGAAFFSRPDIEYANWHMLRAYVATAVGEECKSVRAYDHETEKQYTFKIK